MVTIEKERRKDKMTTIINRTGKQNTTEINTIHRIKINSCLYIE